MLWRWYDCTTMAANLANTKTVAYSGEIDGQKQAADIMVKYAKEEGIEFPHVIGPQTAHKYHPESKPKIEEFVSEAAKEGSDPTPKKLHLTTYSLLYPGMKWLRVKAIENQWERADITAELHTSDITIQTKNIGSFVIELPLSQYSPEQRPTVIVDGMEFPRSLFPLNKQWIFHARKWGDRWSTRGLDMEVTPGPKYPGLCGPIDHAFMSSFVFVRPTGKPLNSAVGAWAKAELEHATEFWRRVFRGDAPVKDDTAITEKDIENKNLAIWGDPSGNKVLKKIIDKLPLKWTKDTLEFNGVKYDPAHHAPILIFPNPLYPDKYVVLNSGPTFREEALLNNSDQTPKLPDWAIVNLDTPPDGRWPGQIIDAGFFDEQWALPKK